MKCREARDLIGAYLYGDLAPEEMRELRVHAQDCALCREELASRGRIVSALEDDAPTLTDEERQRIAWSVKGAVRRRQLETKPLAVRLIPAFGVAAVLVAGVAVGHLAMTHSTKSKSRIAKRPVGAEVQVREVQATPQKNDRTAEEIANLLQSFFNTGTIAPERATLTGRSFGPEHIQGAGQENALKSIEPETPEASPQPVSPQNPSDGLKDSSPTPNNTDTDTDSEATRLPKVEDPKSAETTPTESP